MKLEDFLECRQLKVTCISAGGFSDSEYRPGDLVGSHVWKLDFVSEVYLQIQVGAKAETTEVFTTSVSADGQRKACFDEQERFIFDYDRQEILIVRLYSSRMFNIDSLIGEGGLELRELTMNSDPCDKDSPEDEVASDLYDYVEEDVHITLFRNGKPQGTVILNCQIMLATDGSPPASPSAQRRTLAGFPQVTPSAQRQTSGDSTLRDENVDDRKLNVTCRCAKDFANTAYRFGDMARSIGGNARQFVSQVYVQLDLGSEQQKTNIVGSTETPDGKLRADFQEELVFDYRDQETLKVSAYSKRGGFNTDSLIGEGFLNLERFVRNDTSKGLIGEETEESHVPLFRKGWLGSDSRDGIVTLSCQMTSATYEALQIELPSYDYLTECAKELRMYADGCLNADIR